MAGYDGRGARFNIVAVEGNDLSLTVTAVDSSDVAIDLSTATAVQFRMRSVNVRPGGTFKVNAAGSFVSKPAGTLRYTWITGDTDTPGRFVGEFVITFPGGVQTVPTRGGLEIIVEDGGLPA